MPSTAVYLVSPLLIALIAASLILSGVSKSGSPAPNPMTSLPAALISLAFEVTAIVGDGFIRFKLLETMLIEIYNIFFKLLLTQMQNTYQEKMEDLEVNNHSDKPKLEGGIKFKIKSDFQPNGDQPEAIKKLLKNLKENKHEQVLLGVTGSGKTFTMAKVIEKAK